MLQNFRRQHKTLTLILKTKPKARKERVEGHFWRKTQIFLDRKMSWKDLLCVRGSYISQVLIPKTFVFLPSPFLWRTMSPWFGGLIGEEVFSIKRKPSNLRNWFKMLNKKSGNFCWRHIGDLIFLYTIHTTSGSFRHGLHGSGTANAAVWRHWPWGSLSIHTHTWIIMYISYHVYLHTLNHLMCIIRYSNHIFRH